MTLTPSDIRAQYRKCGVPLPPALAIKPPAPIAISGDVTPEGTITALSLTIALKTVSEANTRRGARSKMVRTKHQRGIVRTLLQRMPGLPALPVKVHLVRIAPKRLDAFDNLPASLKACVDGTADAFGLPDSDERFTWSCDQEPGAKFYAVRVTVEQRKPTTDKQ